MGFLDFFKKKTEDEIFSEAIKNQDYMTIAKLGKVFLDREPDNTSILIPYVNALVKLGKKKEAISTLISFAERKIEDEYYDVAIPILKKALKIDPLNLKVIKLLVKALKKKGLYYEAFQVLLDVFKKPEISDTNSQILKELIEEFLKDTFHPIFFEKYGDILLEREENEEALANFIVSGNMYINLKNYHSALRTFLKARKIRLTEAIDKHLIETISYLDKDEKAKSLLITLLQEHKDDFEFILFTVSQFKEVGKLNFLKSIATNIPIPKLKYTLLTLINYELEEIEEAQEYLNRLRLLDKDFYDKVILYLKTLRPEEELNISFETSSEELPEPDQVLEALDQILDINDLTTNFLQEKIEEFPEKIKEEVLTLKQSKDGKRLISTAEALMGIGNLKKAEEEAKAALNTEERPKAAILLSEIYKQQNMEKEAIAFLVGELKRTSYSEEEKARLKVKLGEIYQSIGEKDRALSWYKEAQKVLKDEDLQEKIEELEKETV